MTKRHDVAAEAMTWAGTPYHHHARVKGVGVDCVQLLCAVYEACGLLPPVEPGAYACDWHVHQETELYLLGLLGVGATEVQTSGLGDAVLFRFGRTWSHGGIVVAPDTVLHAYMGRGAIVTRFDEEPLARRKARFFTLPGMD